MKIEELRIGDLLRVNRDGLCIKKDTIVEVRAVDADDKLIEKGLIGSTHCRPLDDNQFEGGIWCEYLDPIPLTQEILEKNGFKKTTPDKYYPEPRYIWGINSGRNGTIVTITIYEKPVHGVKVLTKIDTDCSHDCGINSIHNCDIEYVHELQHALKLCGIEKEIQI